MGDVWIARSTDHDQPVVIKRLHAFLAEDPAAVERFFDEVALMRQLDHPNIVRQLDGGRIGDTYFLAMEFVDGLTLVECLRANGAPLQPSLAAAMVAQACDGLAWAHHARGEDGAPLELVHRDISPDNLMVDVTGRVRILDFGIARATCSLATTRVSQRRGKLRFMAPEYLRHAVVNERIDVYSMGVTLFTLCTGRRPFEGCEDMVDLVRQLCLVGLPAADELQPDLPPELTALIRGATQIRPADRTASADDLVRQLAAFLECYPAPKTEQIGKLVQKWMKAREPKPRESLGQLEPTEVIPGLMAEARRALGPSDNNIELADALVPTVAVSLSQAIAQAAVADEITAKFPALSLFPREPKVIVKDITGVQQLPPLDDDEQE
jgi:serine/threonine-protein kinase